MIKFILLLSVLVTPLAYAHEAPKVDVCTKNGLVVDCPITKEAPEKPVAILYVLVVLGGIIAVIAVITQSGIFGSASSIYD